ncbi:hypothetical protein S40288_07515 [Stachybotrys chartarum IBT 40288]|nr:hypothetical protein S40288_07515 [Stachybotrys chartarum IBT 40288]
MMLVPSSSTFLLILGMRLVTPGLAAHDAQRVLNVPSRFDPAMLAAIKAYPDPVDAFISLRPEAADELAEPRLLRVAGEREPRWLTEGDKMRLRRQGKKFTDITDYEQFYAELAETSTAGKAHLPEISHQRYIKPLFSRVSTSRMRDVLAHMTHYYTRYYGSTEGEQSSQWLHDHIAKIVLESPFHTHISLEFFTHPFPQSSIIARFEPKVKNFSAPLTIIGAHQDSMNYLFPLLPAPGADDDCSGTVSILEAFRVLAESGYTPLNGPVEFHWYAAEEGGLLGSQAIAKYKKESGAIIGAMMEFDMTAFVARNVTESIGFIGTEADEDLTKWALSLAEEYISIPASIYRLPSGAGSDYMSYTQLGYPSAFASEGNPLAGGGFPGDFDPYVHTARDTMDVDDETGEFSLEHMARFTELAIAYVVEQAGWDNKWRLAYAVTDMKARVGTEEKLSLDAGLEGKRFQIIDPTKPEFYAGPMVSRVKPTRVGGTWFPDVPDGNCTSKVVVLYLHGGAFVQGSGRESTCGFAANTLLESGRIDFVYALQYRLSNWLGTCPFPAALQDALTAYLFLLQKLEILPHNIILCGDSAGGNIAISLLRYISEYGVDLGVASPRCAALFSPCVEPFDFDTKAKTQFSTDFLPSSFIRWGTEVYTAGREDAPIDPYINPSGNPFSLPAPVFVNAGTAEVFYTGIKSWAEEMQQHERNQVTFHEEEDALHDTLLVGHILKFEKSAYRAVVAMENFMQGLGS